MRKLLVAALIAGGCSSAGSARATQNIPTPSPVPVAGVAPSAQAQEKRPGIAVFPFFNGGSYGEKKEDLTQLSIGLQQSLINELSVNTNLRVIDRSTLRELLQEQDLGASGRVDPQTAARIGKVVGARYVVTGGFIDMMGQFQLTGRIVDVETSEVVKSSQVEGDRKKLFSLIVDMATGVTKGVNLPELPEAVREARKKMPVTPEAMVRHGMILSIKDEGNTQRAIELYRDLIKDFPQVEEWKAELRQLTSG